MNRYSLFFKCNGAGCSGFNKTCNAHFFPCVDRKHHFDHHSSLVSVVIVHKFLQPLNACHVAEKSLFVNISRVVS